MNESNFELQHGGLEDIRGLPVRTGEFFFFPASVNLGGVAFDFSHNLTDYLTDVCAETKALVKPGKDAPWVLGRLMKLFNVSLAPEEDRPEKSCFHESFLAVLRSRNLLAVPFYCTDFYCQSSLIFSSEDPPDWETQGEIASGFWKLLLDSPSELIGYDGRTFHSGAGTWIEYGISDGEPYMFEQKEN